MMAALVAGLIWIPAASADRPEPLPAAPGDLILTEVRDGPAGQVFVEIMNRAPFPVDAAVWNLVVDDVWQSLAPLGTIPSGQYRVIGDGPGDDLALSSALNPQGAAIELKEAQTLADAVLTGQSGRAPDPLPGESAARHFDGTVYTGDWSLDTSPTRRARNNGPRRDAGTALVLNEVLYDAADPSSRFIELYYRGTGTLPLNGYRLQGNSHYTLATSAVLSPANRHHVVWNDLAPAVSLLFDQLLAGGDNVYLYSPAWDLLDEVGWDTAHPQDTGVCRNPDGIGDLEGYDDPSSILNGWRFGCTQSPEMISLEASQSAYLDPGGSHTYAMSATNRMGVSTKVDLTFAPPPAGWTVELLDASTAPLADTDGSGAPDVSLGAEGSGSETASFFVAVTAPPPPPTSDRYSLVLLGSSAQGPQDAAVLDTRFYPSVELARTAVPDVINVEGTGSGEQTTLTLTVRGWGVPFENLRGVNDAADVMFVVDDTLSMWDTLADVKADILDVADWLEANVTSLRMGLVSFKDAVPWEIDVDLNLTFSIGAFRVALNALTPAGGGPGVEDGDIALELAANQSWRPGNVTRALVYVSDAETHDNPHLPQVSRWAWNTMEVHTNAVAVGHYIYNPPYVVLCYFVPRLQQWARATAENGTGVYHEWFPTGPIPSPAAPLCPQHPMEGSILDKLLGKRSVVDTAARDPDVTDFDPMVRDVLPPHIGVVPGTFRDPATGAPRPPSYMGTDGGGNTVLEWNLSKVRVGQVWEVAFDATSSLAGYVPTNVYGLSRASYLNRSDVPREDLFPEVMITVLGLHPQTTLVVGQPNVTAADTWVTSATPLSFLVQDRSGTGVAATWYRVDGGAWVNYTATGPFTLSGDGPHTVEWYSEDLLGAVEPASASDLIVDDSPPTASLSVGTPSHVSADIYVTSSTPITLQFLDPGSLPVGLRDTFVRIDGGAPVPYTAPFTLSGEGLHTVEYWSDDLLGNTGARASVPIFVDDTPPTTAAIIGSPHVVATDDFIRSTTPITLQSTDGGVTPVGIASIQFRIDGGPATAYASPFTVPGEGRHTIAFWSVDLLGNIEGAGSLEVVVDNTPPTTNLAVGMPTYLGAERFIRSTTPLSLQAADGGPIPVGLDVVFVRIDGGTPAVYTSPFTISTEGRHTIAFWSVDLLGNIEAAESLDVVVDNTPPTTNLAVGTPTYLGAERFIRSTTPITLQAADGGPIPVGIASIQFRIDGGPATAYASPFTVPGEGRHTIEFWSEDLLGNVELVGSTTVVVDDTPPASLIDVGTPRHEVSTLYVTSATEFVFSSIDGGAVPVGLARIECSIDGAPWADCPTTLRLTGQDGPRTIRYRGTDLLGNAEAESELLVVLDNTAPTTTIAPASGEFSTSTTFNLPAADAGSGVQVTRYRIDGGAWVDFAAGFRLPEGEHNITFRSVDNVGNVEAERTLHVTIGSAPPPPPDRRVAVNLKPLVAVVFAAILAFAGAWAARRRPWKGLESRKDIAKAFLVFSLPFVVAEAATGVVSYATGLLSIPPILGLGTLVDGGILAGGLIVVAWRFRRADLGKPGAPPGSPG